MNSSITLWPSQWSGLEHYFAAWDTLSQTRKQAFRALDCYVLSGLSVRQDLEVIHGSGMCWDQDAQTTLGRPGCGSRCSALGGLEGSQGRQCGDCQSGSSADDEQACQRRDGEGGRKFTDCKNSCCNENGEAWELLCCRD